MRSYTTGQVYVICATPVSGDLICPESPNWLPRLYVNHWSRYGPRTSVLMSEQVWVKPYFGDLSWEFRRSCVADELCSTANSDLVSSPLTWNLCIWLSLFIVRVKPVVVFFVFCFSLAMAKNQDQSPRLYTVWPQPDRNLDLFWRYSMLFEILCLQKDPRINCDDSSWLVPLSDGLETWVLCPLIQLCLLPWLFNGNQFSSH